jgi:hypothetical protein
MVTGSHLLLEIIIYDWFQESENFSQIELFKFIGSKLVYLAPLSVDMDKDA